ncbi:MAG: S8 family serine peptidase [Acidimicrobiales bacterium]|nr:S8 family serine peptidase [Acidimicrobiales bacterium]
MRHWLVVAAAALAAAMLSVAVASRQASGQTLAAPTVQSVDSGDEALTVVWAPGTGVAVADVEAFDLRWIESSASAADKADDSNWTVRADAWVRGRLVVIVDGLTNGTSYDVAVRARTSALTSAWSAATAATPAEPGATVTAASTIRPGVPLGGVLGSAADVDFFKFTVTAAQVGSEFFIRSSGETDVKLILTKADGTPRSPPVVRDDVDVEPGPDNFLLHGEIGNADTFYFKVQSGSSPWQPDGPYTVHLHIAQDTTGNSDATEVTLASSTEGLLLRKSGNLKDVDVFKLVLSQAVTVTISVDSPVADALLQVRNPNGIVLHTNDDALLSPRLTDPALRASLTAGTYYLRVGQYSLVDGPYVLHVHTASAPGSSRADAAQLGIETVRSGSLGAGGTHYWRFDLAEATPVVVSGGNWLRSGSVSDGAFEADLVDSAGVSLGVDVYSSVHLDPGQLTPTPVGDYFAAPTMLPAGTYYLKVSLADSTASGDYLVRMHRDYVHSRLLAQCPAGQLGVSDPLHGCQWYLDNTGQFGGIAGEDINVAGAWSTTKGSGVTVGVSDSGLDYLHDDLADNVDTSLNVSGITPTDPTRLLVDARHGTSVAGILAARDNSIGTVGVAPRATVYGHQIDLSGALVPVIDLASALSSHAAATSVKHHSYTVSGDNVPVRTNSLYTAHMDTSIAQGDGGKGIVQVFSAGNDARDHRDSAFKATVNHRAAVVACGVHERGRAYADSELGANLWVCAPAIGIRSRLATTAPYNSYRQAFHGTSAAAPMVSGVAALVRAANRALTWRDVKLILAGTARAVDSSHSSWATGAEKYGQPGQSYRHSDQYGYGVVDAGAAVTLAGSWTLLPAEASVSATQSTQLTVPDVTTNAVTSTLDVGAGVGFVEHVGIQMDLAAPYFRDLDVVLVSPSGAASRLSRPFPGGCSDCSVTGTVDLSATGHLGEDAEGTWTLRVADPRTSGAANVVRAWKLIIYGHNPTTPKLSVQAGSAVTEGTAASFTINASQAPTSPVTIDYTVTASGGFVAAGNLGAKQATLAANATSVTVTVPTAGDCVDEPAGSVTVTVDAGSGYTVSGTAGAGTVAVSDDDATSVTLSAPDRLASEGDSAATATLRLTLNRGLAAGESLGVPLGFAGGAVGADFSLSLSGSPAGVSLSGSTVTFSGPTMGASASQADVTVTASDDVDSSNERVQVSIPAGSGPGSPRLAQTGLGSAAGVQPANPWLLLDDDDESVSAPAAVSVPSDWGLIPSGLSTGDRFRLLFVSSTKRTALSADIADYDSFVQARAAAGHTDIRAYSGGFRAVASSPFVDASANTATSGSDTSRAIYWLGGAKAADGYTDFWDGTWDSEASGDLRDESGAAVTLSGTERPFTGTSSGGGKASTAHLGTVRLTSGSLQVLAGDPGGTGGPVDGAVFRPIGGTQRFYGLSQVFEVAAPATPLVSAAAGTSPVTEGTAASFTLTASPAPSGTITVSYTVAQTGSYVTSANRGAKQVSIGTSGTATVTVPTQDDSADEPNGTVTVTVGTGSGYAPGGASSATVAVNDDDDPPPSLSISRVASPVTEGSSAQFTITASRAVSGTLSVNYRVGGAVRHLRNGDRGNKTVTLSGSSATVSVPTQDDSADELDSSVTVELRSGSGYSVGSPSSASVTVEDDDDPPLPTLSVSRVASSVTEGSPARFTISASSSPTGSVTVRYRVSQSGSFLVGTAGIRTVSLSGRSASVSVPTADDSADEPDGSVTVTLLTGSGYSLGSPQIATVAVRDNDPGPVNPGPVNPGPVNPGPGGSVGGGGGSGGGGGAPEEERERSDAIMIVADGWSPADVGVASVLAAATDGSAVLYTDTARLSASTRDLLDDYLPAEVIVIGGPAAVSDATLRAIRRAADLDGVERIAGAGRASTAAAVARRALGSPGEAGGQISVVIANGWSPPDIGAAAAVAARTPRSAVLYTSRSGLPEATAAVLRDYRPARIVIVGGTAAVAAATEEAIRDVVPAAAVERLAGTSRTATAAAAARSVLGDPDRAGTVTVVVANGWSPPDIGAAAAVAARTPRSAVLYAAPGGLDEPTAAVLDSYRVADVVIIGGANAVTAETQQAIRQTAADARVARIAGTDRTATAAAAARRTLGDP